MDVLGPDRPVDYKDMKNFVYLERVLKETMRIFPVGPLLLRSVTEDIKLGYGKRYFIIIGTLIFKLYCRRLYYSGW